MSAPHPDYIAQLKERRPEIADFLLRCERNQLAAGDFTAMRHCAQNIMALGEVPDAPQIYTLALSMKDALDEKESAARINLISLSRVLLCACNDALRTTSAAAQEIKPFLPRRLFSPAARKPTLLSIDDDRIIGSMMETMFSHHLHVLTASNGKEGLEMIRLHKPDLVLLDDTMPQMTGMKLLETLREDKETAFVAVMMLTSSDRPQDIARATAAGAVDYVLKPFDPQILVKKVYGQLHR